MIQLNRSMLERYEISLNRPQTLRAVQFGAADALVCTADRLLDRANEAGRDFGVCLVASGPSANALAAQDLLQTLLIRGETPNAETIREERVLQCFLKHIDPAREFDDFTALARCETLQIILFPEDADDVALALLSRLLFERAEAGLPALTVLACSDVPGADGVERIRCAVGLLCARWTNDAELLARLDAIEYRPALTDGFCGHMEAGKARLERERMNYRDDFLSWAEPYAKFIVGGAELPALSGIEGVEFEAHFEEAIRLRARVLGAAIFLACAGGYLAGLDSFAETLRDEPLRQWIGRCFRDEILPAPDLPRERIAPKVISAFERLENSANDMPLLKFGRNLISNFRRTILPAMRAQVEREFEAPRGLALGLAAAIMLYAGARADEKGVYRVQHGKKSDEVIDRAEILNEFSRFSHDMPAESLAYAALADREAWGDDLREIEGLELYVTADLSAIQRIGFRETLKLYLESKD